ncbi:MAG: hypothetical protein ACRBCS_10685 [Cellvibrionaceae bacterium]
MNRDIIVKVKQDFQGSEENIALNHLNSITLEHVMAKSQTNLDNTWHAILHLSQGDIKELIRLTQCAKRDFRDVIYWAISCDTLK